MRPRGRATTDRGGGASEASGQGKSSRHAVEAKKLALLKQMLGTSGVESPLADRENAPGLSPVDTASFPLSFAQERLFVIEQLYDTRGAYNIPILARLSGRLSIAVLEAAFQFLMGRHDALRLSMKVDLGGPTQSSAGGLDVDFESFDLRSSPRPVTDAEALAKEQAALRFSLDSPPLWRVRLYQVADEDFRILVCLHHIIADGGSLAILLEELVLVYEALRSNREPPLPRPPVRFADYVERQRRHSGEHLDKALEYWRRQLSDVPDHLSFGRQPGLLARDQFGGARQECRISAKTTGQLTALARESRATLFMVLVAAWEILLYRSSSQHSFLVAVPVANRTNVDAQRLVGFFVNTVLLRAHVTDQSTFRAYLSETRATALQAFEHQDTPFARLVEELNPERDLERQPLAQVMFVLQNTSFAPVRLSDVELEILPFHNGTAKFDLLLDFHEADSGLSGYLEYRTALFGAAFAEQFVAEYRALLDAIAENPDRTIAALAPVGRRSAAAAPSLTSRELLSSSSARHTLHRRFEECARRNPDSIALSYLGRHLSYRSLDQRSNQLARVLREHGVRRGDAVGVFLRRSPETVVALLAILKSGAAYVPLDPIYPEDRLRQILERSSSALVVSQEELAGAIPSGHARVVLLEELAVELRRMSPAPLSVPVCPDSVAYIVYTSGSTGAPKGVVAHHRGTLNHLEHVGKKYKLSFREVVLQTASLISDASLEDLFGPLIHGCRVVLVPSADARDPRVLLRLIEDESVTAILATTPRFLAELAETAKRVPGDRSTLRLIFVNGEPLAYEDCALAREGFGPQARIVNQYGPTETAVTATEFSVDEHSPTSGRTPLGWPLSNVEFSLLDTELRNVLGGMPGEIYIGGVGLAHGYQAQPAMTAERFVPSPHGTSPGARLYRTGDKLVYTKTDGFCFIGRVDQQVKIRGYRIEPGEIEACIESFPGVRTSVVVPWDDEHGNKNLVAYVVSEPEDFSERDLRLSLKNRLPDYMMPAICVRLGAMPLTPNGKVDRAALPDPSGYRSRTDDDYVRPQDERESELCALFEEVLSKKPVGRHDNFFDFGGHSLAAIRLVSLLSERVGWEVPLRALFLNPTVAKLAFSIRSGESRPRIAPSSPAVPSGRNDVHVHRCSLLEQIRAGALAGVRAAALSTFPNELSPLLQDPKLAAELGRAPEVASITDTPLGRLASIWIPILANQIYGHACLANRLLEAVEVAREIGASVVSLTGLLGSATAQGHELRAALCSAGSRMRVTTGHATTTASILFAVQGILAAAKRQMSDERVAIVGMGSIGTAVAETLLARGLAPKELLLCDVYDRRSHVDEIAGRLGEKFHPLRVRSANGSPGALPHEVYEATLIVGATNAEGVLDVNRLRPRTLLVDDSAPYCFDIDAAWKRICEKKDILITTGGLLRTPRPMARDLYVPEAIEAWLGERALSVPLRQADIIPACALSALLTATDDALSPTIGIATAQECGKHVEKLQALAMTASPLQFSGRFIEPAIIACVEGRDPLGVPGEAESR